MVHSNVGREQHHKTGGSEKYSNSLTLRGLWWQLVVATRVVVLYEKRSSSSLQKYSGKGGSSGCVVFLLRLHFGSDDVTSSSFDLIERGNNDQHWEFASSYVKMGDWCSVVSSNAIDASPLESERYVIPAVLVPCLRSLLRSEAENIIWQFALLELTVSEIKANFSQ